jgi:hypothetical protein
VKELRQALVRSANVNVGSFSVGSIAFPLERLNRSEGWQQAWFRSQPSVSAEDTSAEKPEFKGLLKPKNASGKTLGSD